MQIFFILFITVIIGAINQQFIARISGGYAVIVIDSNGWAWLFLI